MTPGAVDIFEAAPAKLNLYLHVLGRRDDGYHLLDSLVAFTEYGDVLHGRPAADLSLAVDGPFAGPLAGEGDNLVLKAAAALHGHAGAAGAALHLTKNLPVAAGLGGGSADAGAALRLLCRLWRPAVAGPVLDEMARKLGADVPVCFHQAPAYLGGVGEALTPAPSLPDAGIVLVNPGIALPTAKVFAIRRGAFSVPGRRAVVPGSVAELAAWLGECRNDLEAAATELVPAIATVLAGLRGSPGCRLARMAGSGATCFGLYDHSVAAEGAATWLAGREPTWWIKPTRLSVPGAG